MNGKTQPFQELTLNQLLSELALSNTLCAIEVNNTLIPYKDRDQYTLQDGDKVEIVSLVGGG